MGVTLCSTSNIDYGGGTCLQPRYSEGKGKRIRRSSRSSSIIDTWDQVFKRKKKKKKSYFKLITSMMGYITYYKKILY